MAFFLRMFLSLGVRVFAKTYCRIAEKQVFRRKNPGFSRASLNFIVPEQIALFCV